MWSVIEAAALIIKLFVVFAAFSCAVMLLLTLLDNLLRSPGNIVMRSRILKLLMLAFACTGLARGQNPRDGTWWNELNRSTKAGYVAGFIDGAITACEHEDVRQACAKSKVLMLYTGAYGPQNFTNGQIVDGLDHFYQDYRNRSINMRAATFYVLLELQGADPKALDELRRAFLFGR
jgi:hypothetical protein